jgi:hypothetical protein
MESSRIAWGSRLMSPYVTSHPLLVILLEFDGSTLCYISKPNDSGSCESASRVWWSEDNAGKKYATLHDYESQDGKFGL